MKFLATLSLPVIAIAMLGSAPAYAERDLDEMERSQRMICKKYRPTGTRLAKKTCQTKSGWDEMKKRAEEATKTTQRLGGMQNRESGK